MEPGMEEKDKQGLTKVESDSINNLKTVRDSVTDILKSKTFQAELLKKFEEIDQERLGYEMADKNCQRLTKTELHSNLFEETLNETAIQKLHQKKLESKMGTSNPELSGIQAPNSPIEKIKSKTMEMVDVQGDA